MAVDIPSGEGHPFAGADASGSVPLLTDASQSTLTDRPRPRNADVPVARPAPPRPKLTDDVSAAPEAELLEPNSVRGWAISLAVHALVLLVMALWVFGARRDSGTTLDSRIAGSPFGDENGDQLKGGLGMMDADLTLPAAAEAALDAPKTLTVLSPSDLKIDPPALTEAAKAGSTKSGGLNLNGGAAAGAGDGFGVARFGNGGENINGVQVKVGDPQFTLIWDTRVDLDLHVLEPGGSHIYWEERNGAAGGELDVDDVDGFGPENVNYGGGKGQGPPGEYKWYVHFYGSRDGISLPSRWKVRVKHDGIVTVFSGKLNAIGEKSRVYTLKVDRGGGKEPAKDAD